MLIPTGYSNRKDFQGVPLILQETCELGESFAAFIIDG